MATQALRGTIRVPSDKSLSHRAVLFAAMAVGRSRLNGLLDSFDVRSSIATVQALGAKVDLTLEANGLCGSIDGWGAAGPDSPNDALQCGNSGTTARLLLGLLSGYDITAYLKGDESLSRRPMNRVTLPLSKMGARFSPSDVSCRSCISEPFDTLPLTVRGSAQLKGIDYKSPVASAQIKSAVLLAGLNANGQTRITEPHLSRNHSELLLPAFGAVLDTDGLTVAVQGGQQLTACDCEVPGDPSSAAFILAAAAMIPGSEVTVAGMLLNPTRIGFIEVMRRMGAEIAIKYSNSKTIGAEQTGDVTVRYQPGLQATVVEAAEIASLVDEVPILALLATAAAGETVFEQVSELRVKESDRLAAVVNGLGALGLTAREQGDDLHVIGGVDGTGAGQAGGTAAGPAAGVGPATAAGSTVGVDGGATAGGAGSSPLSLETHGDHRLAMTWAIAARAYGQKLHIVNQDCVGVSYPGFFDDLGQLS